MADREELEAMDREELKALLDERGVEYSPHAHNTTLVDLALESEGVATTGKPGEEVPPETPPPRGWGLLVDPYKMVYSPWELPANTAAAQAIAAVVTVDPDAPISAERQAQATAAIQAHQDNVQEVVAGISDDPRLSGVTFEEHATKQAEAAAARVTEREGTVEPEQVEPEQEEVEV
jgi:hypothetical protein